jgi:hypothetical protein
MFNDVDLDEATSMSQDSTLISYSCSHRPFYPESVKSAFDIRFNLGCNPHRQSQELVIKILHTSDPAQSVIALL